MSESDFEEFRVVVTPRKTWEGGISGRRWERWGVGEMDSIASSLAVTPPSVAPSRQANARNGTGGEGRGAGPGEWTKSGNRLKSGDVHVKGMEMKKDGEEAVGQEDELRKYLTDSILYSSRGSSRACPADFDSKPKLDEESFCDLQLFRETFQSFLRKSLHDSFSAAVQQPESIRNHEEGDFIYSSSSQRVGTDQVRQSMAMISSTLCKTVAAFENKVLPDCGQAEQERERGKGARASQLASDVQNTRITEQL